MLGLKKNVRDKTEDTVNYCVLINNLVELFGYVCVLRFKYGFKIVHVPVLTRIHFLKVLYNDKMCIALI